MTVGHKWGRTYSQIGAHLSAPIKQGRAFPSKIVVWPVNLSEEKHSSLFQ
jgi:hypothetical protein